MKTKTKMKNKIVLAMLSLVVLSMFAMPSHAVTFAQLQITSQTTPATITPGSDGYVQITIANSGTAASNDIQISSITVDNPVIVGSYTTDIGNVGSGKSISMLAKFSIPKDTKPGFYVMYIQVKECSESQCKDYSQSAIITVQTTPTLDISIAPTEFKSGEISNLTFEIKNKGGTITDFALTWSSDNILPLGNDNRLFVSSVDANSNIHVSTPVSVMPTTTPGVYTMSISIAYKDQTSNANGLSLSSGYLINGDINLISTVDSQDTITPNSRGTATIKISNAGQDIKFLTLKIATTKEFKKIVPETIYIGNLKSDNYDTEKLTIYTTNIEPKIYPLNATLEYQDVFGKKYSENREFSILVSEPISQTNPVFVLGILVLVAIVIYAGYRIFYRKKK